MVGRYIGFLLLWAGLGTLPASAQDQAPQQNARGVPAKVEQQVPYRQIRGLIQNELEAVQRICELTPAQSQLLLNHAESQWVTPAVSREVARRADIHVHGTIDFEGVVERLVLEWCQQLLTSEQAEVYGRELADRAETRRDALIHQLLVWLQQKISLSAKQQDEIEVVLRTRWRDRWFRSIEGTYDNESLLPEINRSWLNEITTISQRNALANRSPINTSRSVVREYPVLDERIRFSLGRLQSEESVPLVQFRRLERF
jgi:hypothetical protein